MERRTLTIVAIAALTILAIGITAATLTSTVDPGGDGEEPGSDPGAPLINQSVDSGSGDDGDVPTLIQRLFVVFSAIATFGFLIYLLLYNRKAAVMIAILIVVVALIGLALYYFGDAPEQEEDDEVKRAPGGSEDDGSGQGEQSTDVSSPSPLLLVAIFLVLLLLGVAVLRQFTRDADEDESVELDGKDNTEELGNIAGRAADRIEADGETEDDAENEVYRAWREMTEHLDPERTKTTTPREFQQMAVDTGMEPDDVRELTQLFEAVRYGGKSATKDRENRALTVLRRIESKYGEEQ